MDSDIMKVFTNKNINSRNLFFSICTTPLKLINFVVDNQWKLERVVSPSKFQSLMIVV